jgi:AcrR family transcriptional regulator
MDRPCPVRGRRCVRAVLARFPHRVTHMNEPTGRAPISRHTVVDAAMTLVDRNGLAALTIRKLAAEVGAPAMSLYAHFANKEQLHDLMFDRLVQRLFPAHGSSTWQQEFETAGRHARALLLAHPHWIPLLARPAVPVSSFGFYDHLLRLMAEGGLSRDAAVHAFSSAMSFALGFVLAERMMTPQPDVVVPLRRLALLKDVIAHLPRGVYPQITSAKAVFQRWSFDRVFDLGLRSLITGVEASFAPSRRPKAGKRRGAA